MIAARTLVELIERRLETADDADALLVKQEGAFVAYCWSAIASHVYRRVSALLRTGIAVGDRVATISANRFDWIIGDFAIQLVGAVHVPIHTSLAGPQMAWQLRHSDARLVFLGGGETQDRLLGVASELPGVSEIVTFDDAIWPGENRVVSLATFVDRGAEPEGRQWAAHRRQAIQPETLASILYTSGTTGEPKGVMLSQGNLATNAQATVEAYNQQAADIKLNFLPFSHIFARTCDLYTWLVTGSRLALAENRETVIADCQSVHPTLLNGVPYFYEKVARYISSLPLEHQGSALSNILGGKIRMCCSGGAPLPLAVSDLFEHYGIPLRQGYGLSETSPVVSLSNRVVFRRGSVGKPLPGVEIQNADDGEILTRGPHVMLGYWKNSQATAEALSDGWFRTGDLGHVDEDGFLFITGRKKELIVTSAGKKIVPSHLEGLLTSDPLIERAMVVGEGRKYLTALVVPDYARLRQALGKREEVEETNEQLVRGSAAQILVQEHVVRCLSGVSHFEQVQRIALLPHPFSIEGGELTPKGSLRRPVIESRFAAEIEQLYS